MREKQSRWCFETFYDGKRMFKLSIFFYNTTFDKSLRLAIKKFQPYVREAYRLPRIGFNFNHQIFKHFHSHLAYHTQYDGQGIEGNAEYIFPISYRNISRYNNYFDDIYDWPREHLHTSRKANHPELTNNVFIGGKHNVFRRLEQLQPLWKTNPSKLRLTMLYKNYHDQFRIKLLKRRTVKYRNINNGSFWIVTAIPADTSSCDVEYQIHMSEQCFETISDCKFDSFKFCHEFYAQKESSTAVFITRIYVPKKLRVFPESSQQIIFNSICIAESKMSLLSPLSPWGLSGGGWGTQRVEETVDKHILCNIFVTDGEI